MSAVETPAVLITRAFMFVVFDAPGHLGAVVGNAVVSSAETLAQAAEAGADETRRAVTFLILCLIGIAVGLAVLTVWYWHFTSPRRQTKALLSDLGHYKPSDADAAAELGPVGRPAGPPLAGSAAAAARPFATMAPETPVKPVPADTSTPARIEVPERLAVAKPKIVGPSPETPAVKTPGLKPATAPHIPAAAKAPPPPVAPAPAARPGTGHVSSRSPVTVPVPSLAEPPHRSVPHRAAPAQKQDQEGLSDDDWAAVMQSAFKQLKS